MLHLPSRRRFLMGAGVLLAAPAIVRAASLMPVSATEIQGSPPVLTVYDGTHFLVIAASFTSGPPTLRMNGYGTMPIMHQGRPLTVGDLVPGRIVRGRLEPIPKS